MRTILTVLLLCATIVSGAEARDMSSFIKNDDLRHLARGECSFIVDEDERNLCKGRCEFIEDDDLRNLCKTERDYLNDDDDESGEDEEE